MDSLIKNVEYSKGKRKVIYEPISLSYAESRTSRSPVAPTRPLNACHREHNPLDVSGKRPGHANDIDGSHVNIGPVYSEPVSTRTSGLPSQLDTPARIGVPPLQSSYNEAVDPVHGMIRETHDKDALHLLSRKLHRLRQIANDIISKNHQLQHEESTRQNREQRFVIDSLSDFTKAVDLLEERDLTSSQKKLGELQARVLAEFSSFQSEGFAVNKLRDEAIQLNIRFKKTAEKVNQLLAVPNSTLSEHISAAAGDTLSDSGSDNESAASSVPPLLADYRDRKGDVVVFFERIQNFLYNYDAGLKERAFITERGDRVDPSDEQFSQNFWAELRPMMNDLENAKKDAESLARQCEANGLRTTEDIKDSTSGGNSSALDIGLAWIELPTSPLVLSKGPNSDARAYSSTKNRQVSEWIDMLGVASSEAGSSKP